MRNKVCASLLAIGLLFVGTQGFAQTTRHVAVHAGHVLDVKTGKMLADQTIVIEDGKITSVGGAEARIPADAVRIDLPNATVLPGLIDAHTHLTMDPQFGYERLAISRARAKRLPAPRMRVSLCWLDSPPCAMWVPTAITDVALRDAINAGDVPGPRMLVSGPPLSITGGHCDNNMLPYEYHATSDGVADGIAEVQHKVRENIKYGADLIKVCATGGVLSLGDNPQHSQYTLEEMKAIVADAHRLGEKSPRTRTAPREFAGRRGGSRFRLSTAPTLTTQASPP